MAAALSTYLTINASDPNFHIYLCLGQSNMEGNAQVEEEDRQNVPERFKMMAAVDFSTPARSKGEWYVAQPPLVRESTGLTPMDYFGRTMVANLPDEVSVGVVAVAIGGCRIEHLDKDFDPVTVENEAEWFRNYIRSYDNAPYARLLECARRAQRDGVIKGILLHQGESNNGDPEWCYKVKKIYDDLLSDLGLAPGSVPIIAGELVTAEQGGICASMNEIINTLPSAIPSARVVSAEGLAQRGDGLHFTAASYRTLGRRYARVMLGLSDAVYQVGEAVAEK